MNESTGEQLNIKSTARRCPYCHDQVGMDGDKAVCNDCLAVTHIECWEEIGSCPSCRRPNRLVSDAEMASNRHAAPKANFTDALDGELDLVEPEPEREAPKTFVYDEWQVVRDAPDFSELNTLEGSDRLRQNIIDNIVGSPFDTERREHLLWLMGAVVGLILFPASKILGLLVMGGCGYGFWNYRKTLEETTRAEVAEWDLTPFPAVVNEISKHPEEGFLHCLLELDPSGREGPDECTEVNADETCRIVSLDLRPGLARGVKPRDKVLCVASRGKLFVFKPIKD